MEAVTNSVVKTLSQLTVIGDLLLVGFFISFLVQSKTQWFKSLVLLIRQKGLWMSWGIALIATIGSLFFSEAAGYEPCKLCWFQRIFMYPLVVMLLLAALKKDKGIVSYALSLSVIGLVIALYHYYIQVTGVEVFSCSVVGYSPSCTEDFFLQYGYITIPVMSATAFGLITMFLAVQLNSNKKRSS